MMQIVQDALPRQELLDGRTGLQEIPARDTTRVFQAI